MGHKQKSYENVNELQHPINHCLDNPLEQLCSRNSCCLASLYFLLFRLTSLTSPTSMVTCLSIMVILPKTTICS